MSKSLIKLLSVVIIVIFIVSYFVSESGYYEYTMKQRTVITNEKIKEFEQDIKDNKEIDLEDYLDNDQVDYSNKITSLVYNISDNSNKLARKVIKALFKKLGSLVEE